MTTLAAALVARLRQHGVDTIFGIPGVHTAELYRHLQDSGIRHITPRHEQGAGFMADGYARAGGRPGVCFVITGPGLSNIATAMLQARADSIPMLVISGVNDFGTEGRGMLHEMPDQAGFAAQCAVTTTTLREPAELAPAIDAAFALFASKRPGPVHIQIPLAQMRAPCPDLPPLPPPAEAAAPEDRQTADAVALIARARIPIIIAGGGARHAAADALALAERLDCPLVPTINARQGFAPDHPLVVPASLSFDPIRKAIEESDLVLALGTEFGQTDYDVYATGRMANPRRLLRVDIDPAQLASGPAADLAIAADAGSVLGRLVQTVEPRQAGGGAARSDQLRAAARAELGSTYAHHVALLEALRTAAPDAIFVGDSTQLVYAGNMYFAPGAGGGWFNSSSGFGTLGYALPAALGARLARPENTVVALIGDGGAQFTLGEFGSLADEKQKVIVIVWDNAGYGEIRSFMRNRQIEPEGVNLSAPDYSLIAKAYGIAALSVHGADGVPDAFRQALVLQGPVVIHVRGVA